MVWSEGTKTSGMFEIQRRKPEFSVSWSKAYNSFYCTTGSAKHESGKLVSWMHKMVNENDCILSDYRNGGVEDWRTKTGAKREN